MKTNNGVYRNLEKLKKAFLRVKLSLRYVSMALLAEKG